MTDLSKFDGHTDGLWADIWPIQLNDSEIMIKSAVGETFANNADYELMSAAPALLARVKELEEALSDLLNDPTRDTEIQNILEKDWL